jgi:hypothetical protein
MNTETRAAVIDTARRAVLLYDSTGQYVAHLDRFGALQFGDTFPTDILAYGAGYLTLMRGGRLLWLDSALVPQGEEHLHGHGIASVYEWAATRDVLVAYGAVNREQVSASQDPALGFFWARFSRTPQGAPRLNKAELLLPFGDNRAYLVGHRNIATAGGRAYFLAVGEESVIYEASKPPRRLRSFPDGFRRSGPPPIKSSGPGDTVNVYSALENWMGPAGLYSDGELLYLLTRAPSAAGASDWTLHAIDPVADKLIGVVRLPTAARHLLIVPGRQNWLLFEKGRMRAWGQQEVAGILPVPRAWLLRAVQGVAAGADLRRTAVCARELRSRP